MALRLRRVQVQVGQFHGVKVQTNYFNTHQKELDRFIVLTCARRLISENSKNSSFIVSSIVTGGAQAGGQVHTFSQG